jgi:hypothetical protein
MSRSKQTSKVIRRRKAVSAALGVAGALSLASGASASTAPPGDIQTHETAPIILAEEEISDVSLSTFYVFDKESAGARSVRVAAHGGCGHGGCGGRGCGDEAAEGVATEVAEAVEEVAEVAEAAAVAAVVVFGLDLSESVKHTS